MRAGQLEINETVVDYTCNGECSNCGNCCSNWIPVSRSDVKEIQRYIKKHKIQPVKRLFLGDNVLDVSCPFRDDVNKVCTIYPVRPTICKTFKCNQPMGKILANKETLHSRFPMVNLNSLFN